MSAGMPFLYTFLYLLILNITRYFVDLRLNDEMQGYYSILIMPASIIALFSQFMIYYKYIQFELIQKETPCVIYAGLEVIKWRYYPMTAKIF